MAVQAVPLQSRPRTESSLIRFRVTDIETVGHERASEWLDPVGCDPALLEPILPDSRLKDPVKVAANLEEVARRIAARPAEIEASILARTAERDERLALDLDCNRIVCLGWVDVGAGDPVVELCHDEAEEKEALRRFWQSWSEMQQRLAREQGNMHPHDRYEASLVTFFGLNFDMPCLMRRSLYLGVKYPTLNVDRYRTNHIDIFQKLSFNGAVKPRSLKFYCKRFGIQTGDPFDGGDVAQMVKEGHWEDIASHCIADIGATHALAERLGLLEAA